MERKKIKKRSRPPSDDESESADEATGVGAAWLFCVVSAAAAVFAKRLDILVHAGMPDVIVQKLRDMPNAGMITAVEFFAGVMSITKLLRALGKQAEPFDARHSRSHDLNTLVGLVSAIWLLLRVVPGGLTWFAPPCSSWVSLAYFSYFSNV